MSQASHMHTGRIATLDEIKCAQLEIVRTFANFCDNHHLTFALAFGSLLGAVRHNGFIPWDDDIDLMMPWEDYSRFCRLIRDEHQGFLGPYRVADPQVPHANIDYHSFFMKIYDDRLRATKSELTRLRNFRESVFIDIFPQISLSIPPNDVLSDTRVKQLYHCTCDIYNRSFSLKRLNPKHPRQAYQFAQELCGTLLRHQSTQALTKQYITLMNDLNVHNLSEPVRSFLQPELLWTRYEINKHDAIGKTTLHPFESLQLPIPIAYNEILTEYYGEWKTLPPLDQQQPSHAQVFIWQ